MTRKLFILPFILIILLSLGFVLPNNLPSIKIKGSIVSENEARFSVELDRMGFLIMDGKTIDITGGKKDIKVKKEGSSFKTHVYCGDRFGIGSSITVELKDIKKPEKYMIPGKDLSTSFKFDADSMRLKVYINLYREVAVPMILVINNGSKEKRIPVEKNMKIAEKLKEGENEIYITTLLKPLNIEVSKTEIIIDIERLDALRLKIGERGIWSGGEKTTMDTSPFIISGRTFVPIRFVSESLGGTVLWDGKERKVTIILNGKRIEMWIGKNYAYVNGNSVPIDPDNQDITPFIKDDRTFVPLRFVSESLGMKVIWIGSFQEIFIFNPS